MYFSNDSARWIWQPVRSAAKKTLAWFYCLILMVSPVMAWAEIACNLYRLPELQRLCQSYPEDQQFVHDEVPDNDLNKLRDSWGSQTGLHILPPDQYGLTKPLELVSGQAILPHPTSVLPEDQLRTIKLVAASEFAKEIDNFPVLKLNGGSSAGGMEIHSRDFSSLPGEDKSLVSITSADAKLLGSYLQANHNYYVEQLISVQLSAGGGGKNQPVLLERNWLDAYSATRAVSANLHEGQRLTVRNSIIQAHNGIGLEIEGGIGEIFSSDIVVDRPCNLCVGVRFKNNQIPGLVRTAFWASGEGTAIEILLPEGQKGFEHGFFKFNAFSPELTIVSVDALETPFLFTGAEFTSKDLARGFPGGISVADFFNYPGDCGVAILGSQFVDSNCLFNNTNTDASSLCFQNNTELSKSAADLYFAPNLPSYPCQDPDDCIDPNLVMGILIPSGAAVSAAITFVTIFACYYSGKRARKTLSSGHQLMFHSGSSESLQEQ